MPFRVLYERPMWRSGLVLWVLFAFSAVKLTALPCGVELGKAAVVEDSRPWHKRISFTAVERRLKSEKIVGIERLEKFQEAEGKKFHGTTEDPLVLRFANGLKAVWKIDRWGGADAEEGAYRLARQLRSRLVPPTVTRVLTPESLAGIDTTGLEAVLGKNGSLQYYISGTIDLDKVSLEESLERVSAREKFEREMFYFVFGQWDRHRHNFLIDHSYAFGLIDNAGIRSAQYVRFGETPFLRVMEFEKSSRRPDGEWPPEFPFETALQLNNPTLEELTPHVSAWVSPRELEGYWKGMQRSVRKDRTLKLVLWRNRVWVQSIGYANYGPIVPKIVSKSVLAQYEKLDFGTLRKLLAATFTDERIREMIHCRDQIVRACRGVTEIP